MHRPEGDWRGNSQHATGGSVSIARLAICLAVGFENPFASLVIDLTNISQAETARGALEQPRIQLGFDRWVIR